MFSAASEQGGRPSSELLRRGPLAIPLTPSKSPSRPPSVNPSISSGDVTGTDVPANTSAERIQDHQKMMGLTQWFGSVRVRTPREEWWREEADKSNFEPPTAKSDGGRDLRRRCTNPFMAFVFVDIIILYGIVLAFLVTNAPEWRWLRLEDDSGNLCGVGHLRDRPYVASLLNPSILSSVSMSHRNDDVLLSEWIRDHPEDWPLIESAIYEIDGAIRKECVASCQTTEDTHWLIFPQLQDCPLAFEASSTSHVDDPCLTFPNASDPFHQSPLLGSFCYPSSSTYPSPLQHPVFWSALKESYSWMGTALTWTPVTLSQRSLTNLHDLYLGITMIPVAVIVSALFSTALLAALKYVNRPILVAVMYTPLLALLGGAGWSIYLIVDAASAAPGGRDPPSIIGGSALLLTCLAGIMITLCMMQALKPKVKLITSLTKSTSNFCHSTILAVVPSIISITLSALMWAAVTFGIVLRTMIEDHQQSFHASEVQSWNVNFGGTLRDSLLQGNPSRLLWTFFSLCLGIWVSATLRGWSRIAVALMVKYWIDECGDSTVLGTPTENPPPLGVVTSPYPVIYNTEVIDHTQRSSHRVLRGTRDAIHHLGTCAWGGLILTVTGVLRKIVKYTLEYTETLQTKADSVLEAAHLSPASRFFCSWHKMLVGVLTGMRFILAVLDRAIRFLTSQAYIHTALFNTGFVRASLSSFLLLVRSAGSAASILIVSRLTNLAATLVVTIITTTLIWACLVLGLSPQLESHGLYLLVAAGLSSCFVSRSILRVHNVVMDTLLHLKLLSTAHGDLPLTRRDQKPGKEMTTLV